MPDEAHDEVESLLQEFRDSAESVGIDLRLDLASIILRSLRELKWTQKELANESGLKASYISRLIHADANCTFETAGRIMHALGLRAKLAPVIDSEMYIAADEPIFNFSNPSENHGTEKVVEVNIAGRIGFSQQQQGRFRFSEPHQRAGEDAIVETGGEAGRSAGLG